MMSIVNWVCLYVAMVQQLMNIGLALNIKESGIDSIIPDRIVEGQLAKPNQFPWMAAIYINGFDYKKMKPTPNSHAFACGGTIIRPNTILTAAHCIFEKDDRIKMAIYKYEPVDFRVVVGSSDIAGNSLEKLRVESIFVYPKFNNESAQNDIALIKLSQPLIFDNTTQLMNLPRAPVPNGQMAMVAGWGDQCQPDPTFTHLRFASVKIMPFEYCADRKITEPIIEETALCVGPDKHTAKGDSGSGLWIEKDGENYLIGIASFSPKCVVIRTQTASMFTNVFYFYDWIIENL